MQIVTDTGMDMVLPPEQLPEIDIHLVRHAITLEGKTYLSGADIQPIELQQKLMATASFPTTSQPSAGDFAALYKQLAATDPDNPADEIVRNALRHRLDLPRFPAAVRGRDARHGRIDSNGVPRGLHRPAARQPPPQR